MTIAYWCVFAAALLPYACTTLAKWRGGELRYDNHAPRDFLAKLEGWRKRADWAQLNSFEAFPAFAAAVIMAQLQAAPQGTVDALAGAFVVVRIVFCASYVADLPRLRSLCWGLGFTCTILLFLSAAGVQINA